MALRRLLVGVALVAAVLGRFMAPAFAHALPLSYVDLRLDQGGLDMNIEAPAIDLAHDLPDATADDLLTPAGLQKSRQALAAILVSRLVVTAGGQTLTPVLQSAEPVLDQKTVRFRLRWSGTPPAGALTIRCLLFPYDPRHKTFVDVYQDGDLKRQLIFTKDAPTQVYARGGRQSTLSVVGQFLFEGVHHIFLGPDHILFVIGLLLLGGTLKQLLKIVSAFTLAHSVTLALATLNVLNPPARLIEPAIAASIVFVGVHSLLTSPDKRDWRLVFAFGFGFIHGFGFANALREMELPRAALVWSLFSFNAGVEVGQACIVLAVAPLLALLRARARPRVTRRVLLAGSLAVIGAGAFWFVQRVVSPG